MLHSHAAMRGNAMTTELTMLAWSVVLGLVQIVLATVLAVQDQGLPWAMSPRDNPGRPPTLTAARLGRVQHNFMETFPFFAAAVLIAHVANRHSSLTALGAHLYFWARLVYIPLYAMGVPMARTLVWTVSVVGIVLILLALA
jgi:uncharacterized MAPEG superfamily protein